MSGDYREGQKWISNAEPELGMGRISAAEHRLVTVYFDLAQQKRTYAKDQAPLSRAKFNPGDTVRTTAGLQMVIRHVSENDGLLVYHGDYQGTVTAIIETDLDPNVTFSKPEERLFTQQIDGNEWFNHRYRTLVNKEKLAASSVGGLLGPRVALIPHQFYIADEVASRYAPRVLLADEVGLGKTIEAGLILHQQLITGQAQRIMIIVPEALTFQWFVEMIRRFNLQFTILDEERCQQIQADNSAADGSDTEFSNPFDAQQLVLCSLALFTDNPDRLEQATEAEWDMIVVDEAHHLDWHEGEPGMDYLAVQILAQFTRGLLLLTATPEQLGRLGHFSRLRLLDPSRYHDYDAFLEEETQYEEVAHLVRDFQGDGPVLEESTRAEIRRRISADADESDAGLVHALLDRHGTGRVLFRNVRESVAGFPSRQLIRHNLNIGEADPQPGTNWQSDDPRVDWLKDLLSSSNEKFLVFCTRADTVIALERLLHESTAIRSSAFHEHMDLVARDRAANYFADEEFGAQVLICSEIGSEGRNFQFAHHMVMWDLPGNPDLLEQRIGRLDRIGQRHDVKIHVPAWPESEQLLLLDIYDKALAIFSSPNAVAQTVFDELPELDVDQHAKIVATARKESERKQQELKVGRDRLIELNSHRPTRSAEVIEAVRSIESDASLEDYMEESFELFGLESELLSDDVYRVKPTESMVRHAATSLETMGRYRYPELPEEGITYTYHRDTALAREDVQFLTWENPIAVQALDLVASDITGNNTVIAVKIRGIAAGTLLLETLHVVECTAPAQLAADRYLPPVVIRSLITTDGKDVSGAVGFNNWPDTLDVARASLGRIVVDQEQGIRTMLAAANDSARDRFQPIRDDALAAMTSQLGSELARLRALGAVNPNVRPEEIEYLEARQQALTAVIENAQIRLDALRVIIAA